MKILIGKNRNKYEIFNYLGIYETEDECRNMMNNDYEEYLMFETNKEIRNTYVCLDIQKHKIIATRKDKYEAEKLLMKEAFKIHEVNKDLPAYLNTLLNRDYGIVLELTIYHTEYIKDFYYFVGIKVED